MKAELASSTAFASLGRLAGDRELLNHCSGYCTIHDRRCPLPTPSCRSRTSLSTNTDSRLTARRTRAMLPASPYARYGIAIGFAFLVLHFLGQATSPSYRHSTSLEQARVRLGLKERPAETWYEGRRVPPWREVRVKAPPRDEEIAVNTTQRVSATFVMLARNSDVWGALDSIRQVEGMRAIPRYRL